MKKIIFFTKFPIILLVIIFISCTTPSAVITELFVFPKKISEASAVEVTQKSKLIWTLEDSGNDSKLFALDESGAIKHTLFVQNAPNTDWEDLTSDDDGNLYIGDFGNNDNERKDLCIYKIDANQLNQEQTNSSQKIAFYFPEQKAFPPKKSKRFYDVEAFFYYKNNFYLFTKNRSSSFDGTTLLYRIPNTEGNHAAELLDQFVTCDVYQKCAITSADISTDGKKMVLLSATQVWVFEDYTSDLFFKGKIRAIDLEHYSQKEGICFADNSKLYIVDEKDKKTGGKLYQMNLDN